MSATLNAEYNSVLQIASVCLGHDPKWRHSLDGNNKQEAVNECASRVDKLTTARIQCGALVFEKVKLRETEKGREIPIFTKLGITIKSELTKSVKDARIYFLSEEEAQFYLLFGDRIIHVEMSPTYKKIAHLFLHTQNLIWDITSTQMADMMKQKWNQSFVTACYNWDLVAPIPGVRGEAESKTKEF